MYWVLMMCNTYCGSSDVFSYPEDESVLDPLLAKHLAHFGIDFSSLQKVLFFLFFFFKKIFMA